MVRKLPAIQYFVLGCNLESWSQGLSVVPKSGSSSRPPKRPCSAPDPGKAAGDSSGHISIAKPPDNKRDKIGSMPIAEATWKPARKYEQEVHGRTRGSKELAIETSATEEQKKVALGELLADGFSRGSGPQREAAWSTWRRPLRH